MSYGQDATVGISFQNSYGTANVASLHWLEPISESVNITKAQNQQKGLRANIYDVIDTQEGSNAVAGDITIEAKANHLGVLLAANNNLTATVTSGALYTHTFKPRQADHSLAVCAERPFTYLKYLGDTGSAQQYYNLNASNIELSIANGELLTAKMGIVGGDSTRIAAVAAVFSASNPIDWSVSSVMFGGSIASNVRALTITQENNIVAKYQLDGTKTPGRLKRSERRKISIAGTLAFDDQSDYNNFLTQATGQFRIFLKGTSLVQSGYYESLMIEVPKLLVTEYPVSITGPGELEVGFKGEARYHVGSATAIVYTLQCGKAGF